MTTALPDRPSLENLKKQAKTLLKSHKSGDLSACTVLRRLHRFSELFDQQILESNLTLAEAQYALAMEYGFPSWNALKEAVNSKKRDRRFLHLLCGDMAAESLRRSGVPGEVRVWYDAFTEGPVPDDVYGDEWFELRASQFLGWMDIPENAAANFRNMYKQLDEYRDSEEVILWFDACLFDQTILIHHLDWFSKQNLANTRLSLICIGEFPGFAKFNGLGELKPDQMESLLPLRREVTKKEMNLATLAWNAYRSPDPTAIEEFLSSDTSALPYIAPAFKRHLERFPSTQNGLERMEQEALQVISEGYSKFADVFAKVWDLEDPPYFSEHMLFSQLNALAKAEHPLLRIEGWEHVEGKRYKEWPVGKLSVFLTHTGREVLGGKEDHIRLNGIDRWLGGAHLKGDDIWRWNGERLTR